MTMLLQWRRSDPAIILVWRGPDNSIAPASLVDDPLSVPTIIGPPGMAGPPGPVAEIIDGGTFN
jgi:hypothetical protein